MPARALRTRALRALPPVLALGLVAAAWAADPAPAVEAPAPAPRTEQAAAVDPHDLGRGLRYLRLGTAPIDEPTSAAALAAPALVLDLRLATGDATNEALVRHALSGCTTQRPLFVLLGADTPAPLRAALPDTPGLLTLAAHDSGIPAKLVIATPAACDRAAAEALATGKLPREFIDAKIEKPRFDEAQLTRDHANGRRESTEPTPTPAPKDKTGEPAKDAPAPLQDMLLQRAVFIHRALLALDRIPEHS